MLWKYKSLTCHSAVQDLCWAPDQTLVVSSNGTLCHGPVDVVELVAVVRVLQASTAFNNVLCFQFLNSEQHSTQTPTNRDDDNEIDTLGLSYKSKVLCSTEEVQDVNFESRTWVRKK